MDNNFPKLKQKDLLIIFTYAPAGFGHLRVTDALYHGLPSGIPHPTLLGADDKSIVFFHRLMSVHPLIRRLSEWTEVGVQEEIATYFYRNYLRSHTEVIYNQLINLLNQRIDIPSNVLIISTHFGLAHQIASIKKKLEAETNIKINLVVQVTDDTPIHIWYIEGADLILVPSEKTKKNLIEYVKRSHFKEVKIEVVSYPLSPLLSQKLTEKQQQDKFLQVNPQSKIPIQMAIPLSGAAVGTQFFTEMISVLYKKSDRFKFHVITKIAPYTQTFIKQIEKLDYVNLYKSSHDKEVVDLYEKVYQQQIISLEVTKPSEQAFKALFNCEQRGGSILLLSEPVGKQEYDNLDFLRRHSLIPSLEEEKQLWQLSKQNLIDQKLDQELLKKAQTWRGIAIPNNPKDAANFIFWCLEENLFTSIITCKIKPKADDPHAHELNSDGVHKFWQKVEQIL